MSQTNSIVFALPSRTTTFRMDAGVDQTLFLLPSAPIHYRLHWFEYAGPVVTRGIFGRPATSAAIGAGAIADAGDAAAPVAAAPKHHGYSPFGNECPPEDRKAASAVRPHIFRASYKRLSREK